MNFEDIPTLPAIEFTWPKYIGKVGYAITQVWDFEKKEVKPGFKIIGKTDSSKLKVRPSTKGISLMVEDEDFEQCWFHIWERKDFDS